MKHERTHHGAVDKYRLEQICDSSSMSFTMRENWDYVPTARLADEIQVDFKILIIIYLCIG